MAGHYDIKAVQYYAWLVKNTVRDDDVWAASTYPLLAPVTTVDFDLHKEKVVFELENNIADKSRATEADEDIIPLLHLINHHHSNDFFTTSSCAGRIIVTQSGPTSGYNVEWLYVSHKISEPSVVLEAMKGKILQNEGFEVWLKMESPIVAICARNLEAAQKLLIVAKGLGFKKPTLTGVHNKVMVSIVDNKKLEVPIAMNGTQLAPDTYIATCINLANKKLLSSRARFDKLAQALAPPPPLPPSPLGF
ncbi:tRNA wybutosine-synthesizing protein 2/3/4 [Pelomyxa schiedti]|nr:tRNA wybutosine-synthesizing protein 2/3/4 [Pelomyxa schiedti]